MDVDFFMDKSTLQAFVFMKVCKSLRLLLFPISCGSERWDLCLGLWPGLGLAFGFFAVLGFLWVRFMIFLLSIYEK